MLRYSELLSEGETDITKEQFLSKFESVVRQERVIYITIDAESTTTATNFSILIKYLKIVSKYEQIKMFTCKILTQNLRDWYVRLREDINAALMSSDEYSWAFIKPITSHPCNSELMFVLIRNDHFPSGTKSNLTELGLLFNDDLLSKIPFGGFTRSTLQNYINSSLEVRELINGTLLRYNNSMKYKHKFSHLNNQMCGICCLTMSNNNELVLSDITRSPRLETEFNMDATTRKVGTPNVISVIMCHIFYSLVYNLTPNNTINGDDIVRAAEFEILYFPNSNSYPLLWHRSFQRGNGSIISIYEDGEVKNYYREGRLCICVGLKGKPWFISQYLLISVAVYKIYPPWFKVLRYYVNSEQLSFYMREVTKNQYYRHTINRCDNLRDSIIEYYTPYFDNNGNRESSVFILQITFRRCTI